MITKNTDIHDLTTAEITRQISVHSARRQQIVEERAEIYAAVLKSGGVPDPAPLDDDEKAAREHAKRLLNGSSPEFLSLPPEISREKALYREMRGLDLVIKILADKELVARAADAVSWAELHSDEWRQIAREIVLGAIRLDALERRARALLEGCPDLFAVRLPMATIANCRSISEVPLGDLKSAGLADGVVTNGEIRKAEHV